MCRWSRTLSGRPRQEILHNVTSHVCGVYSAGGKSVTRFGECIILQIMKHCGPSKRRKEKSYSVQTGAIWKFIFRFCLLYIRAAADAVVGCSGLSDKYKLSSNQRSDQCSYYAAGPHGIAEDCWTRTGFGPYIGKPGGSRDPFGPLYAAG